MEPESALNPLSQIEVCGFKSLIEPTSITIRPLTILAGANSSGKSSIMQPLLLMKQTLEATFEPDVFLLNGPNIKFTAYNQFLSRKSPSEQVDGFWVKLDMETCNNLKIYYAKQGSPKLQIAWQESFPAFTGVGTDIIAPNMSLKDLKQLLYPIAPYFFDSPYFSEDRLSVQTERCFLSAYAKALNGNPDFHQGLSGIRYSPFDDIRNAATYLIHISGLRGNKERSYPATYVEQRFKGEFDSYTASTIENWQEEGDETTLNALGKQLALLGLTWKAATRRINDAQIEVLVGRLVTPTHSEDLVNIADVGIGVSQTLPVLVALLKAVPGQMVYIEQPEIHLHPRAQVAMAQILVEAAQRGVRVIVETHSSLLLLSIQSLVAEGKVDPSLIALHWFFRSADGITKVDSAELDEDGAFGDWDEDFGDVMMSAESRYLDAVDFRRAKHK